MKSFTLFLMLGFIAFTAQAQSGIFESYLIVDAGSGNTFYDLQATTGNPDFTGNLGSFAQCGGPLLLNGAQNKTFKCPGDDILNGKLWYRVYPVGSPSGAFLEVSLPFGANLGTGCNGNDQMWQRTDAGINLLANRAPGTYTLEVYTSADFTFTGGGGGSGTHFSNNGGANYSANFTVTGDASCPVFVTASGGTGFAIYTTLKAAFDAVNAGTHTGVIAITIAASTTEGTTPATLNSSGAGSASYTSILIRPSADGISVSGNPVTGFGVIQLNGADNVTIDGDNPNTSGTNRNLTINNTTTNTEIANSVIRIATSTAVSSADNITIKNCNLNGNVTGGNSSSITSSSGSSNSSFGIYAGGNGGSTATGGPFPITSVTSQTAPSGTTINNLVIDNNAINQCARGIVFNGNGAANSTGVTVTNNTIGGSGSLSGVPPYNSPSTTVYTKGIYINGTTSLNISGNTIQNILSYVSITMNAIELAGSIGATGGSIVINNNTITGVVNNAINASPAIGILVSSATITYNISGNTISTIQNFGTSSIAGIFVSSSGPSGSIQNNRISSVYARNTGGYGSRAIFLSSGNNVTVQNNMIWDLNAVSNNTNTAITFGVRGIAVSAGIGHKIYHNSVALFGAMLTGGSTADVTTCLSISGTGQTGLDIRNNIFSNTMSGGNGTMVHTCVQLPASGTSSMNLTLNNNAYFSGSGAANYIGATTSGLTTYTASNFNAAATTPAANLRAYTSTLSAAGTNDNASFASTSAAPFTSATDLHIPATTNTLLESGAAAV
ncbi:MAG TPA: hypothetical protein PLL53_04760, partial [Saprospiraceae bacterium]|nr:hypothetical protein [Saprospiraceae bacterium]